MRLVAGSRLDSYEIIAPLGAGGKGEVYRARDTSLNRDVAIKVLPDHWSRDPGRLHLFEHRDLETELADAGARDESIDGPTLNLRLRSSHAGDGSKPRFQSSTQNFESSDGRHGQPLIGNFIFPLERKTSEKWVPILPIVQITLNKNG